MKKKKTANLNGGERGLLPLGTVSVTRLESGQILCLVSRLCRTYTVSFAIIENWFCHILGTEKMLGGSS